MLRKACVEARRAPVGAADVLADYEAGERDRRLPGLGRTRRPSTLELPLGEDFGTYSTQVIPCAYAFDHYTHIRADLFAPRGPLGGLPPPSDELRVVPALDWIEAALPQQNRSAADQCTVEIRVTGIGARVIKFGSGPAAATICSDAPAVVHWITQRGSWAHLGVQASGDEQALRVAGALKVF